MALFVARVAAAGVVACVVEGHGATGFVSC